MMNATQPTANELIYKEIHLGKSKTVKYYELINGDLTNTPLTELLRVSENQRFAKSNPKYWLSVRGLKRWETKPCLTGMFITSTLNLLVGDHNKKESLMIFDFKDVHNLKIKFYKGYYPNQSAIKTLLNQF